MTIPCPCCAGTGVINRKSGVARGKGKGLTLMQARLYDTVARCPDGIASSDIASRIYADRSNGGPLNARHCINVFAHHANKRLKPYGERLVAGGGPGSLYRLERLK